MQLDSNVPHYLHPPLELRKQNMAVKEEQPLKVYYEEAVVGEFFVDLFVENEIIVELKSVESLSKAHACPVQFTLVTACQVKFTSVTAKRI